VQLTFLAQGGNTGYALVDLSGGVAETLDFNRDNVRQLLAVSVPCFMCLLCVPEFVRACMRALVDTMQNNQMWNTIQRFLQEAYVSLSCLFSPFSTLSPVLPVR
jgi:hypothetical protein